MKNLAVCAADHPQDIAGCQWKTRHAGTVKRERIRDRVGHRCYTRSAVVSGRCRLEEGSRLARNETAAGTLKERSLTVLT